MEKYHYTPATKMSDILKDNFRRPALLDLLEVKYSFNGDLSVAEVCDAHRVNIEFFLHICNIYTFDDYSPEENLTDSFSIEQAIHYFIKAHNFFMNVNILQVKQYYDELQQAIASRYRVALKATFDAYLTGIDEQLAAIHELFNRYLENPRSVTSRQVENVIGLKAGVQQQSEMLIKQVSELSAIDEYKALADPMKYYLVFLRNDVEKHSALRSMTLRLLPR